MRSWLLEGWRVPVSSGEIRGSGEQTSAAGMYICISLCIGVSRGEESGESEDLGPHHRWPMCPRTDTMESIVWVWGQDWGRMEGDGKVLKRSLTVADVNLQLLELTCSDANREIGTQGQLYYVSELSFCRDPHCTFPTTRPSS